MKRKILNRMRGHGRGNFVFTWKDFRDFGSRAAIDQTLARLCREGVVRRVARGMYDLPRTSKLLRGPAPASTDAVLDAVRRHDKVEISDDNVAAANALGLTTAVPVQPRYRTTGGRRNIRLGETVIELRPAGEKLAGWLKTDASVPVQALLYLGRKAAHDPKLIHSLRRKLSDRAIQAINKERRPIPAWIDHVLELVAAEDAATGK